MTRKIKLNQFGIISGPSRKFKRPELNFNENKTTRHSFNVTVREPASQTRELRQAEEAL